MFLRQICILRAQILIPTIYLLSIVFNFSLQYGISLVISLLKLCILISLESHLLIVEFL
jgi:hypothetical protein